MNIQNFPENISKDVEDQSLSILKHISELFVVIGGWAVRAIMGEEHGRYTLDIDGVTTLENIEVIKKKLLAIGMDVRMSDWGIQFFVKYVPSFKIEKDLQTEIDNVELRVEISEPRIQESLSPHYFEFDIDEYEERTLKFHNSEETIKVRVPPIEHMTAVKMGLPVDYKNNYDSHILLQNSEVDEVIRIIKSNDDWDQMVIRRIPKLIGRISDKDRIEYSLATANDINIKENISKMRYILERLNEKG